MNCSSNTLCAYVLGQVHWRLTYVVPQGRLEENQPSPDELAVIVYKVLDHTHACLSNL